jgi:hypothetical protein
MFGARNTSAPISGSAAAPATSVPLPSATDEESKATAMEKYKTRLR